MCADRKHVCSCSCIRVAPFFTVTIMCQSLRLFKCSKIVKPLFFFYLSRLQNVGASVHSLICVSARIIPDDAGEPFFFMPPS